MLKKLIKYGNSHALVLDKALLELLNIDAETTKLKISTDGKSFTIKPVLQKAKTEKLSTSPGEVACHYTANVFSENAEHFKPEVTQKEYQNLQAEKNALRNEFITKYNVDMETIFEEKFCDKPAFCKELDQLNQKAREQNLNTQEYAKSIYALTEKYSPFPEFMEIRAKYEQRITEIGKKYLVKNPNT